MNALRRLHRDRRGMTLVESVVVMAIFILLLTVTAAIILSSMNVYSRAAFQTEMKMVGDAVYDFYANRLTYAMVITGTDGEEMEGLAVSSDGHLLYRPEGGAFAEAYTADFYHGCTIEINASINEQYATITILVENDDGQVYKKESAIRLVNIGAELPGTSLAEGGAYDSGTVYFSQNAAAQPEEPETQP